jgi:CoA-dependent NAD(P)H sulfur oxidoreductase
MYMRIIVIGGVAAGMSAAASAKRQDKDAEVIVFERGQYISYGACGLPYFISNKEQKPVDLLMLTPENAMEEKGVDVRVNCEVLEIDTQEKKIHVRNVRDNISEHTAYDKLIIATGASPVKPEIPGINLEKVFFLKTLQDGIRLKDFIWSAKPKRVVIIGDGQIGLEAAEAFKLCGVEDIKIISKRSHICWWLDADMAEMVEKKASGQKIDVIKEANPLSIVEKAGVMTVNTDKSAFDCDFVFISLGMKPNAEIAVKAGIKTGMRGSITVNNFMETSVKDVYAAGDCSDVYSLVEKSRIYMPRGTTANKQGRWAGINAAGGRQAHKGITAVMVFKSFDLEIGRMGLGEDEARRKKMDIKSVLIKSMTRAGYYPGAKRIFVKLIADKKSGEFLGGQMTGGEGVAKRMDILSTALYNNMTVDEMKQLDLSYSPPLAPVWDPVLIAINKLSKNEG